MLLLICGLTANLTLSMAQTEVRGKVSDAVTGVPLDGATVRVTGASSSSNVLTDIDGNYTISIPNGNVALSASFIGYQTMEKAYAGEKNVDFHLTPESSELDEVVIVGYGSMKSSKVTGAISTARLDKMEDRPITNVSQALSGSASGIQVTSSSGQPGVDGAMVRIRGYGTLNSGQDPLILIDGIASIAGFQGLNPHDIENVTILKDAASSAIYGSRAANGVILITTKKGFSGKPTVNYNGYVGWQSPTRMMGLITDMSTHMSLINEAKANLGMGKQFEESVIDDYIGKTDNLLYPNTDWLDIFYGTPTPVTNHNVSVSGQSNATQYNFSYGFLDQKGLDQLTGVTRHNMRWNNTVDLTEKLKFNSNIAGFFQTIKGPDEVMDIVTDWGSSPGIAVMDENGQYGGPQIPGEGNAGNPLAVLSATDRNVNRENLFGKLSLEYNIVDGLTIRTDGGLAYNNEKSNVLNQPWQLQNFRTGGIALNSALDNIRKFESNARQRQLTSYTTVNYAPDLGNHYLNIMIGQSVESFTSEQFSGSINDIFSPVTPVLNAGVTSPLVNGGKADWAILSFFGRVNYDYQEKYLIEMSIRRDGSSRFSSKNRWGIFPSISAGWRISKEDFFPTSEIVSDIKLRGSYGSLGNQSIGNYPYQSNYSVTQNYSFGDQVVDGAAQVSMANEDLKWETTFSSNIGMDLSLLHNKIDITFDWYNKLTKDILVQVPIPNFLGGKTPAFQNVAEVRNWGWDLEASYREVFNQVRFDVGLNVSQVNNEVTKFNGDVPSISGQFIIQEGLPFQSIYGYRSLGIFQSNGEVSEHAIQHPQLTAPGDIKYEDINGDERIDAQDRQVIGNTIPKYQFGMNFNVSYGGVSLGVMLQGVAKVDRYLQGRYVYPFATNDRGLTPDYWLNRWTPDNPSDDVPRLIIPGDYPWNYENSSFWIENGAFLRIKNVSLSYQLPETWLRWSRISNTRLFVNAQNLFTFTKFSGYDPETNPTETTVGYPQVKIISAGLQFSL